MKAFYTLFAFVSAAILTQAHNPSDSLSLSSRHARLARHASDSNLSAKSLQKRCPKRTKAKTNAAVANKSEEKEKKTSTTSSSKPKSTTKSSSSGSGSGTSVKVEGLINVKSSCGKIGAKKTTTATEGPNGSLGWLNCGIEDGGWRPPYVTVNDIIATPLSEAIKVDGSPFKACSKFVKFFNKYGDQYGIQPIMLASFAMQESSCNPNTVGGGGEQGLMQLTNEKCGGAPGGNCRDPEFNIRTAAKFFRGLLDSNGGNLLLSIGSYNGWYEGLTKEKATAARWSACCRCQNNLDYLHQFLNAWVLNINAYSTRPRIGKYFNLDDCP